MTKEMSIVVSTTDGQSSFANNFFSESEAKKLKEFAESLGYATTIRVTEDRFKDALNPFRKRMIRDIDWSDYQTVLYVIKNRDKTDVQIVRGLNSEGSGFSITVKRGIIMTEYTNLLEQEGKKLTEEQLEDFAKKIALGFSSSNTSVQRKIDSMLKAGCVVGESTYPECKNGFHAGCLKCPHNKKQLTEKLEIDRFNKVLDEEYEDE